MNQTFAAMAHHLLFEDPETGETLVPVSAIENDEETSSYSFEVANRINTRRWKHTIKTEEI